MENTKSHLSAGIKGNLRGCRPPFFFFFEREKLALLRLIESSSHRNLFWIYLANLFTFTGWSFSHERAGTVHHAVPLWPSLASFPVTEDLIRQHEFLWVLGFILFLHPLIQYLDDYLYWSWGSWGSFSPFMLNRISVHVSLSVCFSPYWLCN